MSHPDTEPFALFDDATWSDRPAFLARGSERLIEARTADEVMPALAALEAGVGRGLIAAGYCAYELGYVFEPRLRSLLPAARPLMRFHLFADGQRLSSAARAQWLLERRKGAPIAGAFDVAASAATHGAKVERVRQLIGDGDVYQVNLTFKLRGAAGDPFATYAALRAKARSGACSFLRFGDEDVLSFSPELFFAVRGGRIFARPMKGTVGREPDVAGDEMRRADLVSDEKQRAENLMIVDLLRNDLARVSVPGSVTVTDLFSVETYPRFHTMTSGIEATLQRGVSFARILPALFPCGSVTGAPKIRAMEIIRELEDEPRGVYCGAVGYLTRETMAFNVAIRTLTLRDGRAEMGVGGGIVWDSEPAAEYAECLLKARFLTEAEAPFRLIETLRWTAACGFHLIERHLQRLRASSRYFGFVFDEAVIRRALQAAVAGREGVQRVRLTLGPRGDTEVEAVPIALSDTVWRYAMAPVPMQSGDWRVHHKTTQRDIYDSALKASGCDEVVFVNERGEVTEGSRTNVFLERDGVWLTPPLSSGLLDGCLRRELIENGPQRVREQVLRPDDLGTGTVWFGNALRGLIRGEAVAPSPGVADSVGLVEEANVGRLGLAGAGGLGEKT
ncbi:MAG: aminodeoxychorismate synthase component I [Alphaproteobacteria bacterium]|nr:aminodeoxychorismate synthase component I [Alphaproteobacteria bacterium]